MDVSHLLQRALQQTLEFNCVTDSINKALCKHFPELGLSCDVIQVNPHADQDGMYIIRTHMRRALHYTDAKLMYRAVPGKYKQAYLRMLEYSDKERCVIYINETNRMAFIDYFRSTDQKAYQKWIRRFNDLVVLTPIKITVHYRYSDNEQVA